MPLLESDLEYDVVLFCKSKDIRCEKLKLASKSGWPDRTLLYKGCVIFLELKRPKEKPTPLQQYTLDMLAKEGFQAYVVDSLDQAESIINDWKEYVNSKHV